MLTDEEHHQTILMIADSGLSIIDASALLHTASEMNMRWAEVTS
jgi:hypothetical protein